MSSGCFHAYLKELTAKKTGGSIDDIKVVYHVDGNSLREPDYHRFEFSSSTKTHPIGRGFPYTGKLEITLHQDSWAEMMQPGGTKVGTITIADTSETSKTVTVSGASSEYELTYDVTEEESRTPVEMSYMDFMNSDPDKNRWDHIDRSKFLADLGVLATGGSDENGNGTPDVFELEQGSVGYCSPIAIDTTLLWRKPRRFVEFCRALIEKGAFLGRTNHQDISDSILRKPKERGMDQLEWVITISLKDADNWVDSASNKDLQEATYNEFEKHWLKELVGYPHVLVGNDQKGDKPLRQFANLALDNGTAILGVDGTMFMTGSDGYLNEPKKKQSKNMQNNHAVTLVSKLTNSGGNTQFEVQSWGRVISVDHPKSVVNDYLFDAVGPVPKKFAQQAKQKRKP